MVPADPLSDGNGSTRAADNDLERFDECERYTEGTDGVPTLSNGLLEEAERYPEG